MIFEHAPLSMVLCQVKFPPVFSLMGQAGVSGFQEGLRLDYPKFRRGGGRAGCGWARIGSSSTSGTNLEVQRCRSVLDSQHSVDFVALEAPSYTDFADFRDRFEKVLAVIEKTVHPSQSRRLGFARSTN